MHMVDLHTAFYDTRHNLTMESGGSSFIILWPEHFETLTGRYTDIRKRHRRIGKAITAGHTKENAPL